MKLGFNRILSCILLSFVITSTVMAVIGIASGFETSIDFDSLPPGTGVEDQYESRGVVFEPPTNSTPGAIVEECDLKNTYCTTARSGNQVIRTPPIISGRLVAFFIGYAPLTVRFLDPTRRVSLHVREYDSISGSYTGRMTAYDSAGDPIARDATSFKSDTSFHQLEIERGSASISQVRVTMVDSNGSTSNEFVVDDLEFGINEPPRAGFVYSPEPGETETPVSFDASDSSDRDGDISYYLWDFDSDGTVDRNTSIPYTTYRYKRWGDYLVTLQVVDDDGARDEIEDEIYVNAPPRATFDYSPIEPSIGQLVSFDGSGSSDRNGEIRRYEWDFQTDRELDFESEKSEARYAFDEPGRYIVSLTVYDNDGADDTYRLPITVTSPDRNLAGNPVATFNIPQERPETDLRIEFNASGSDSPNGEIVQYQWDFDDGSPTISTDSAVTDHVFSEPGTYSITLTITDATGETDTTERRISVLESGLGSQFDIEYQPKRVAVGEDVQFTVTGRGLPPNRTTTYRWDFDGDGDFDHQTAIPRARGSFDEPGNYRSRVQIVNNRSRIELQVDPPIRVGISPTAAFSFQPERVVVGDSITFDASLSEDPDGDVGAYQWDFDNDGEIDATGIRIPWKFDSSGPTSVRLVVEDTDGYRDEVTRRIFVSEPTIPPISLGLLGIATGLSISFPVFVIFNGTGAAFASQLLRPDRSPQQNESKNREGDDRNGDRENRQLVVDSVHVRDSENDDLNNEYVVLKNEAEQPIELSGVRIGDDDGNVFTVPPGYELSAGETVRIHTGTGFETDTDLYWGNDESVWDRDIDWVILRNSYGETIDVAYYQ